MVVTSGCGLEGDREGAAVVGFQLLANTFRACLERWVARGYRAYGDGLLGRVAQLKWQHNRVARKDPSERNGPAQEYRPQFHLVIAGRLRRARVAGRRAATSRGRLSPGRIRAAPSRVRPGAGRAGSAHVGTIRRPRLSFRASAGRSRGDSQQRERRHHDFHRTLTPQV
jgi:hypothetical protein